MHLFDCQFLQQPAGQQQACTVRSSVVGQPDLHSIAGQFVGMSRTNYLIALDLGVCYLTGDILVGEANNHTVLGGVVLAFVLYNQAFSGIEPCLETLGLHVRLDGKGRERVKWTTMLSTKVEKEERG